MTHRERPTAPSRSAVTIEKLEAACTRRAGLLLRLLGWTTNSTSCPMATTKSPINPDPTIRARRSTNGSDPIPTTAISARRRIRATTTVHHRRSMDRFRRTADTMALPLLIPRPVILLTMSPTVPKIIIPMALMVTRTCIPVHGAIEARPRRPTTIRTAVTWNSPKPSCARPDCTTASSTTRPTGLAAFQRAQREIRATGSITATTVKTELQPVRDPAIPRGSVSLATEPKPGV